MGKGASQLKIEDLAALPGSRFTANLQLSTVRKNDASSVPTVLEVSDNDVAIGIALISQYEALYQHFDNQANRIISVLIAMTPILLNAPLFLSFTPAVKGGLIMIGGVAILILGIISTFTLRRLRVRMKIMSYRSKMIQSRLGKKIDAGVITQIQVESSGLAEKDTRGRGASPLSNRTALWNWFVYILVFYSALYILGGAAIIKYPSLLDQPRLAVELKRN